MISDLYIATGLRQGKTFLKRAYYMPPFQVADITENKNEKSLRLMVMNSSPGILDGDEYRVKVVIEEGSSLELQTQSYQRLFTMKQGASQNMEVNLQSNASFYFLPHPVVPHKNSVFTAKNKLFLKEESIVIWGEVITCGRKLNGEAFCFSKYHSLTEIFLDNKLVVKENLLLQPSLTDIHAPGQMEGYSHQASFIYIDKRADINALIGKLAEKLLVHTDICYGISGLPVNGLMVRIFGSRAEQLFDCLKEMATVCKHHQYTVITSKPLAEVIDYAN